jgi:hypothetical protein
MSETSDSTQSDEQGSVYDRCDAAYLRQLHETSGMDETQLARIACLSVAQVRQLAAGGDSLFYSQAVKRQAYKRLLLILGAPPPSQVTVESQDNAVTYDATPPRQTIDDIVALSERHQYLEHRPVVDFMHDLRLRLVQYRQPLGALAFLMAAIGLLVFNWPRGDDAASATYVASNATSNSEAIKPNSLVADTAKAESLKVEALKAEALKPETSTTDKPTEKAADTAATAATTSASTAATPANKACAYRSDKLPEGSPVVATKEGRYVYFVSPVPTDVCVVDGNRQVTMLTLRPGEGRSVYGAPPWQVSGADLAKMQIFFQGSRVVLPEGAVQQGMALPEKPF